ncbi:lysozyme-like protein [Marasmius fiardii PR-910]|nr:lysozyme-like protein [Marasmius fiardii PR-910]
MRNAQAANNSGANANTANKSTVNSHKQTISLQVGASTSGLLNVGSSCGDIGATYDITNDSGPNGTMYWINCGINSNGWRPRHVGMSDLKVVTLQDHNSPFQPCARYMNKFIQYANEFNIPPIVMASFAMQESSCNLSTIGGGSEVGLMQITPDKCGNAPGGNCFDPGYNIRIGAAYFRSVLDQSSGNVLQAMGMYNGWKPGMTIASATAAADSNCCRCQNNLDYLFQMLNSRLQNINPYLCHLGKYFNLDICHY